MNRSAVIIIGLFVLSSFAIGCYTGGKFVYNRRQSEARADTVTIYRTLRYDKPAAQLTYRLDKKIPFVLPVETEVEKLIHDTIWLPQETRVYEDSLYKCQVSGYKPNLDWIEIYSPVKTINRIETQYRDKRWGVGIQAGYGVSIVDSKIKGMPYIGFGISYNILTF